MRSMLLAAAAAALTACASQGEAQAPVAQPPERISAGVFEPIPVQTGVAPMLREYNAPEARQGVAVDAEYVYAIVNSVIAKYDKETGVRVAHWSSPRGGPIRHLNSCYAEDRKLWCANSNFPQLPMASSVEVFDAETMAHHDSLSLGVLDEGSLTFFEPLDGGWIAGFAHYDAEGGLPYKPASFAEIVTYDADWRRTGGYLMPESVRERMAPHAASGGAIGADGLLYLFGHDRPEMYVLAKPKMGPVLEHIATIEVDAAGQAFAWDRSAERHLYAINRPTGTVRVFEMPEITLNHPNGQRFR